jgi:arginase family enzyme
LTGAFIFGLTYQQVFPQISALANYGNVIIPDLWNVSPFLFILTFSLMALLLFYMIDRVGWQRKESNQ